VVSTVLLVAITVVLAAVLFVIVSSLLVKPPVPPAAFTLDSSGWIGGNETSSVTGVTGAATIPSSDLTYVIRDADGTSFYAGQAEQPTTTNSITVTVHYRDRDGGDRITQGDQLIVEVVPISGKALLEGGVLEVHFGDRQIANHAL
jgi:FlaG/FlaF family flagellin (archaellin)